MGEFDLGKPDGPALPKNLAGPPTIGTSTSTNLIGSESKVDKDTASANTSWAIQLFHEVYNHYTKTD